VKKKKDTKTGRVNKSRHFLSDHWVGEQGCVPGPTSIVTGWQEVSVGSIRGRDKIRNNTNIRPSHVTITCDVASWPRISRPCLPPANHNEQRTNRSKGVWANQPFGVGEMVTSCSTTKRAQRAPITRHITCQKVAQDKATNADSCTRHDACPSVGVQETSGRARDGPQSLVYDDG
jgi:hypothetical protein